ncbi:Hypothetical protein CINCED_3A012969 [Cinara cedri]|uniref:Uncharacterized protein n=1 Tax=Cinara cedri TaxID=506608 RepID=A0A5E4M9F5_9HEMI|nr:Hypothetical protein CINCED_3A012969 [Cinara cedri]
MLKIPRSYKRSGFKRKKRQLFYEHEVRQSSLETIIPKELTEGYARKEETESGTYRVIDET